MCPGFLWFWPAFSSLFFDCPCHASRCPSGALFGVLASHCLASLILSPTCSFPLSADMCSVSHGDCVSMLFVDATWPCVVRTWHSSISHLVYTTLARLFYRLIAWRIRAFFLFMSVLFISQLVQLFWIFVQGKDCLVPLSRGLGCSLSPLLTTTSFV